MSDRLVEFNVKKGKELAIKYKNSKDDCPTIILDSSEAHLISLHRILGLTTSNDLPWSEYKNTE